MNVGFVRAAVTLLACVVLGPLSGAAPAAAQTQTQTQTLQTEDAAQYRQLLDRYCVTCHNERLRTAEFTLDSPDADLKRLVDHPELWEKVVRKLRAGSMPPVRRPRPDEASYDGFRAWLETALDQRASERPDPGRTETLHRLSRTEYHNTVRDLLDLEVDVTALLPADDTSYGFDNIAGVLGVSPTLMERYLSAARKISRLAVAAPVPSAVAETFRLPSDLGQDGRVDGLPFGTRGGTAVSFNFPEDAEYVIEVLPDGALRRDSHTLEISIDGERVELFSVGARPDPDAPRGLYLPVTEPLRARVRVRAGPRTVAVAFINKTAAEPEGLRKLYRRPFTGEGSGGDSRYQPYVDSVTISGPFEASGARPVDDPPSRRRIFVCYPADDATDTLQTACAREILAGLAGRAFRRPVADDDVDRLMTFYDTGKARGFDAGIEFAIRRLLVSPEFLFRIEPDPDPADVAPGTPYRLSDLELASRLSFFLWSSIPDDELLAVAARGELSDPVMLESQLQRMLADPRAEALVTNFAGQWLGLRNVMAVQPDEDRFPDFGEGLRRAFRRETELFFSSVLREDRSVIELLSADYTFVNERLALHYGIPNVRGSHFRRVVLNPEEPNQRARGGLLGQGSVLAVTSYANRTSPVLRGKWVLENVLGTPPPPPPPDVPPLAVDDSPTGHAASMRDAMERHRANPVCASCHQLMDPPGLAMEHYDAVGRWRDSTGTAGSRAAIDAAGTLPDGSQFEGPAGLKRALLRRPDRFVTTVTEKLLTYALGRGIDYRDAPAVRAIVRNAAGNDYRLSSLVAEVVRSLPFQMRRSES